MAQVIAIYQQQLNASKADHSSFFQGLLEMKAGGGLSSWRTRHASTYLPMKIKEPKNRSGMDSFSD